MDDESQQENGGHHDEFLERNRNAIADALRKMHEATDERWDDFAVPLSLLMSRAGLDLAALTGERRGMTDFFEVSDANVVRLADALVNLMVLIGGLAKEGNSDD